MLRFGWAALAAVLLGPVGDVEAGYIPQFINVVQEGSNFRWNYNVVFTTTGAPTGSLQTGNGTLSPGTVGSQDFLTLYDIEGYVAGSAVAGGGHTLLTPLVNTGVTGPNTLPTDSPAVVNLTFRFSGGSATADTTFTGFSFLSTLGPNFQNPEGFYTSQFTNGATAPTKIGEVGRVILPSAAVPEPTALAMLGLGSLGLLGLAARRRKA